MNINELLTFRENDENACGWRQAGRPLRDDVKASAADTVFRMPEWGGNCRKLFRWGDALRISATSLHR